MTFANLDLDNLPQHIAIIMDGNRRWAKQKMFAKIQGHRNAVRSVRAVVETSVELGIGCTHTLCFFY